MQIQKLRCNYAVEDHAGLLHLGFSVWDGAGERYDFMVTQTKSGGLKWELGELAFCPVDFVAEARDYALAVVARCLLNGCYSAAL